MVKQIILNNQNARKFADLEVGTQQLAWTILGKAPTGTEDHLIHLGENLRHSEPIIWAAKQLIKDEPLGVNWQDWCEFISWDCLKSYHEERHHHLKRTRQLVKEQRELIQKYGMQNIDNLGIKEFEIIRNGLSLNDEDWLFMEWAAGFHDICSMGYEKRYWQIPKFSRKERADLEAHARLFYYFGEFFNVHRYVTALSVLHHYPNLKYPKNGVVEKFADLLENDKFTVMLSLLVNCDIYEALTGVRAYSRDGRQGKFTHEQAMQKMPKELGVIGSGYLPLFQALKEANQGRVLCPN